MDNSEKITIPSNSVDKLTLECLMNRNQYKRYIEKTDPTKFSESERHLSKILKYKHRILELTEELLNDPDKLVTLDVNEMFDSYSRTLIRHFETKDLEKDDLDTMFDNMDKDEDDRLLEKEYRTKPNINNDYLKFPYMKSFWGKDRIVKRPSGSLLSSTKTGILNEDDIEIESVHEEEDLDT